MYESFWGFSYPVLFAIFTVLCAALIVYNPFSKPKPALIPSRFQTFKLASKIRVSPNTCIYRFALPRADDILGLPVGQHILVEANINGKNIQRMYTPVSSDDDRGHFDLMIKTYEQGNISKYMSTLKIGDTIRVKGPRGRMRYHSQLSKEIGMIAGGTGITPMMQIIRASTKDPSDRTRISLIYANVNRDDILLKEELDQIQKAHSDRFSVYYVLNNPPAEWEGGVGFVSKEMIADKLPSSKMESVKLLLCGPDPMLTAMKKHLEELEYDKCRAISKIDDQVFCF